jgi:hypothetical protein
MLILKISKGDCNMKKREIVELLMKLVNRFRKSGGFDNNKKTGDYTISCN